MKLRFALICAICGSFLFSCTSLQDVVIDQTGISGEFLEIHSSFASVDGGYAAENGNPEAAENLIGLMDSQLSEPGLLKTAAARIYALKGCVELRLGRKSEAKKMLALSLNSSKGDVYAAVLSHRLNPEEHLETDSVIGNDKAIFILEDALDFYSAKNYISAVSSFDEAFLSLADFYRNGYGKLRDECWNLRNLDVQEESDSDFASLVSLSRITAVQMLLIAQKSTDGLYSLTGGKKMSEKELFKKASEAGLFDAATISSDSAATQEGNSAVSAKTIVNKFLEARFLWNLYNENKSLEKKTKYSARFSKIKMRSPVPDVPVSNPDFDAVLGCVENEFLHLEDGIHFNGEKEVSGSEVSEALKKVKN